MSLQQISKMADEPLKVEEEKVEEPSADSAKVDSTPVVAAK